MVKPGILTALFPRLTWHIPADTGELYLTFDDGPVAGVTPWVLDVLQTYNAKATFFCLGKNVRENPAIYERILDEGHAVGNHTYDHAKGWITGLEDYLDNVKRASYYIQSGLFRPPHGRLRPSQVTQLKKQYDIIMWNVLSCDFDQSISEETCLQNVLRFSQTGSIVVFHDSYKAQKNMQYALPRVLEHFSQQGYRFSALQSSFSGQQPLTKVAV